MLKILYWILSFITIHFFILDCAYSLELGLLDITGKAENKLSYYPEHEIGKETVYEEIHLLPEISLKQDNAWWSAKIVPDLHIDPFYGLYQDVRLFETPQRKTILTLREFYAEVDLAKSDLPVTFRVGKQLFEWYDGVKFDFVEMNPFGARDQSEPFLTREEEKQLGVWGTSLRWNLANNVIVEFIANGHNNPIIATRSNDRWTRALPDGVTVDDYNTGSDINFGLRTSGTITVLDKNAYWGIVLYRGAANSIDHVSFDSYRAHPVLPEQNSAGAYLQSPIQDFNLRIGGIHHWQIGSDHFMPWSVEIERLWEDIFQGGDNLLVECGYAGVWTSHKTDISIPELDMRRVLKNHFVMATEYSPYEGLVFKLQAAQRLDENESYVSPETVWDISKLAGLKPGMVELSIKGEIIYADSNRSDSPFENDIFTEYKNDDRAIITLTYNF